MKRIVSGIQPSGEITLGNYIGAIKQFIELQNEYDMYIMIVDLHAITIPQERLELRKRIKDMAALYIACGLDINKVNIFIQSEIPAHSQLNWIFQCNTYIGELNRMTQYKEKSSKSNLEGVSSGLYTYPSLMAADILLYDADLVPVGEDQKQHLELTRDLASRFNNKYGETFVIPSPHIPKIGAKIMDLQEPSKKMSKSSDNPKSYISLLDDINISKKKIKSAVTDTDTKIIYDKENKPGVSNLLTIYEAISTYSIKELENKYKDKLYGEFKTDLANTLEEFLKPIHEKFKEIRNSKELDDILDKGAHNASKIAYKKIIKVNHKVGLGRKK